MKQTVVVVEDNADVKTLLLYLLSTLDCKVLAYESAEEMLAAHKGFDACLYLVDHGLPGMNGNELIKKIKEKEPLSIIFMISFNSDQSQIEKVYGLGADHYITKPFNPDSLVTKIKNALLRAKNTQAVNMLKGIKLIPEASVVTINGKMRKLSEREFSVFNHLYSSHEQTSSRNELLKLIGPHCNSRNVDSCVSDIRKSLTGVAVDIKSVRGAGYKLIY